MSLVTNPKELRTHFWIPKVVPGTQIDHKTVSFNLFGVSFFYYNDKLKSLAYAGKNIKDYDSKFVSESGELSDEALSFVLSKMSFIMEKKEQDREYARMCEQLENEVQTLNISADKFDHVEIRQFLRVHPELEITSELQMTAFTTESGLVLGANIYALVPSGEHFCPKKLHCVYFKKRFSALHKKLVANSFSIKNYETVWEFVEANRHKWNKEQLTYLLAFYTVPRASFFNETFGAPTIERVLDNYNLASLILEGASEDKVRLVNREVRKWNNNGRMKSETTCWETTSNGVRKIENPSLMEICPCRKIYPKDMFSALYETHPEYRNLEPGKWCGAGLPYVPYCTNFGNHKVLFIDKNQMDLLGNRVSSGLIGKMSSFKETKVYLKDVEHIVILCVNKWEVHDTAELFKLEEQPTKPSVANTNLFGEV